MPDKVTHVNVDNLIERYLAGESPNKLAQDIGVSTSYVRYTLKSRNVPLRSHREVAAKRRKVVDVEDIAARYRDGESELSLARSVGVDRRTIRKRLLAIGVSPRGRSDAMRVRMAQTTPEDRAHLAAAAHAAVRGRQRSESEMIARAKTWERLDRRISPLEGEFADMLTMRGVKSIPQLAVGRYNVDLAVGDVAVEVHHSVANPLNNRRLCERGVYLTERGWRVLYVWVSIRAKMKFTDRCADEAVALLHLAQSNPTAFGQYRVIRGTGEHVS